ncbi:phage major capsid protein [Defluviimonas aestuarii]|uniref:phage major capsid protein n=1 Tax=Albidovulum aestuarii TaxID=1130726 RepID=UPI00249A1CEB|nr:phage major capsid protein [Defluviimonas aestuarii]MDI3335872.1 phage major capsid protein [Defluviimonas aestuarii]
MKMKHDPRFRGLSGLVRADATGAKAIVDEINKAFNEFKDKHAKDMDDVVRVQEVDRINAAITELNKELTDVNKALAAAKLGGAGGDVDPAVGEHAQAFNRFFRKGVDNGLTDLEVKAKLTTQSDPDGGYLVPEEMESTIDRVLGTVSSIRAASRVINISSDSYKKLVNQGGAGSGWVGETQARPETNTPTLAEIVVNAHELYANPAATQKTLDDAAIDIAEWLADEVGIVFAEQEGAAFAQGDGVNKPRGIFSYTTVANASYAWGKIGFIGTGASGAFPTASTSVNPADPLISLYYGLKAGYRNNASWLMSDATMETVRKLKDVEGKYVWSAPTEQGEVATILRKPVISDDNCPAIGANNFPIAFGDFRRGYLIVDRVGIRVLRDPYTNKPNVHFYTTKRVGGGVVNFEAIKLLKMA